MAEPIDESGVYRELLEEKREASNDDEEEGTMKSKESPSKDIKEGEHLTKPGKGEVFEKVINFRG